MGQLKHGHTRRINGDGRVDSPEYRAYTAMKNRCLNPRQDRYKDYAGRGITICDRWLYGEGGRSGFECFLADMGQKPSTKHSLDREENELGYTPNNCRWATSAEQARNTRVTIYVEACGMRMPLADAVEYFGQGLSINTARRRISRGWEPEAAVITATGKIPAGPLEVCF